MPWTGPYVFTRDNSAFTGSTVWNEDRLAGTKITAAHHDFHDQDIADGFALVLRNDGANHPTTDISWGSHKITALAYGTSTTDAAAFGQTIEGATLNPSSKVLTVSYQDGTTFTVDFTPIVVAGDTSDFARLSLANNFLGINTFSQAVVSAAGLTIPKTGGNVDFWRIAADNSKITALFSGTYNGTAFSAIPSGGSGGDFYAFGSKVWTAATLDPSGFLTTTTTAPTITGTWTFSGNTTFTGTSIQLPGSIVWTTVIGGASWNLTATTSTQLDFTDPTGLGGMVYVIDPSPKAGAYLQIGNVGKRVWDQGSLQSALTTAPTGGEDGNLAVVQSGADRGLWTRISGVWTKLIAFP